MASGKRKNQPTRLALNSKFNVEPIAQINMTPPRSTAATASQLLLHRRRELVASNAPFAGSSFSAMANQSDALCAGESLPSAVPLY